MSFRITPLVLSLLLSVAAIPTQPADAETAQANPPPDLVADLVTANQILADQGVLDGFGHVSVRLDGEHFLLSRSMAPALVTADDILVVDIASCNPIDAKGRSTYLERFIHCEIYRRDPDVASVVHTHAPALIPFGVTKVPLKPVFHMGGFLGGGVPVFEIRQAGGAETDLLIRDEKLGRALAETLGNHAAVLMRGHGATIVGTSLKQAVFRAVYTVDDARLEADALHLGPVTFLNDVEARKAAETNDGQIGRAWDLWRLSALKAADPK
jgi:ribulose-5-phosphate 4-epimerase/fuculose-1-phosphate aldolase